MDRASLQCSLDLHRLMADGIGTKIRTYGAGDLLPSNSTSFATARALMLMRLETLHDRPDSLRHADEADDEYARLSALRKDAKSEALADIRCPPDFPDPTRYRNLLN